MTKQEKQKKYCSMCRDDFYNGKNPMGVKECWHLEKAEVVWKKIVPLDQRPPWTQRAQRVLSCCHVERAILVAPNQTH